MAVQIRAVGLDALRSRLRRLADDGPIKESLRANLAAAWASGAEAFIRAAVRRVLVDTGMSAASFFPLSRAIKSQRAEAAIDRHIAQNNKRGQVRGEPTFPSGRRRGGFQDTKAGERLGQKAFTYQVPAPGSKRIIFRFAFSTVVFQHAIHEEPPQNRQSLAEGIVAFEETIRIRFIRDARFIVRNYLRTGRPPRGLIRIRLGDL